MGSAMTTNKMLSLMCILFLTVLVAGIGVSPVFAESTGSALGLEPGAYRLCNDDLGVILWGPDDAPTLSVGKSDIWDRRNPKPPEPVLTLQQIMERARAGDKSILNGAGYYTGYNSHDFPCPKPAGQLILQLAFLKGGGKLAVDQQPRQICLTALNGAKKLTLRIFVSAVRNVIVLTGEGTGLEEGDVAVRLYRHRDTILPGGEVHPTLGGGKSPNDFEQLPMPTAGAASGVIWVEQDFGKDPTFPDGFASLLAAQMAGPSCAAGAVPEGTGLGTPLVTEKEGRLSHGLTKRFTPINDAAGAAVTGRAGAFTGPFQIYATVVTSQDPQAQAAGNAARAGELLAEAAALGSDALWAEHQKQWDRYDAQPHARAWSADGTLKIDAAWGGVPYKLRPFGYYGDVSLCSVDSTKFCYQDSSMWHADFHFNEIEATGLCMQRQFDLLASYFVMIRTLLPMAQANAREVYGCAGAMYPLVHYPLKADSVIRTHISWEQSMEISALLAKPFWLRFLYTWDMDFLHDTAYPVLSEGARFYADFLHPGPDGVHHVFPTVSPEHRGITKDLEFNRDTQSSIALIRYHLRAAARAAALLGVDPVEAQRWLDIAEKMPPYPTVDTPEGPIFIDVAGAQPVEYNIAVPLSAIFWGDDIGLDSPPEQRAVAERTLRLINVWEPHRGYLKGVRRRLGIFDPADGMALENLLQSHTGILRVFPAVPPEFEGGFENLGAEGGFIVAANRANGRVQTVVLESLAGQPCIMAFPWPDGKTVITDVTTAQPMAVQVTTDSPNGKSNLLIETIRGHKYRIKKGP
jgi:hypothetical protein